VVHADNKHKFITGINTALKEAKGDYILFSQGDVRFEKSCIELMLGQIKENHFSIIQPVFLRNGLVDNAGMDYWWPGYGLGNHSIKHPYVYCTGVSTSITFITSRDAINLVGYYDTSFAPAYIEDVDWAIRSWRYGIRHLVVPQALVHHRHNESFSTLYKKKEISDICRRNRRYLIEKHYRGLDRILRLTVTACLNVVKESFDVIRDRWITPDDRHKVTV